MKPTCFSGNFTITAHTGCENTPDNTLEAVEAAFQSGADIFEVDIRFDQNGVPILAHNEPVGGEVELEQVFALMKTNESILCNLDIKVTDHLSAVAALAKEYDLLDRVFYTGIHEFFVEKARTDTPEIPYYLNMALVPPAEQTDDYLADVVAKVKSLGAIGVNCHFGYATPKLVETVHQNDLLVSLWTVNEKEDMLRIMKLKPDNITTRKPVLLRSLADC